MPIHIACLSNDPNILDLMIKNGGDMNLPDIQKSTPLH